MNELTEHKPAALPMTAAEIKGQRDVIVEIMRGVMVKDVHYGVIPGTQKPTLLKGGSDMLLSAFHIAAEPVIEDLSTLHEIRYRVRVRGTSMGSGNLVGVGIGECSSGEEKYKWKKCGDRQFQATPENMRREKWKSGRNGEWCEKQVRTEPADLANTILKMAKKRAQIDLTLTVLAAGDIFQNDVPPPSNGHQAPPQHHSPPPSPSSPPPSNSTPPPQDDAGDHGKAIFDLRKMCDQAGLREIDVWAQFHAVSWGDIKPDQVADVKQFIEDNSP